MVQYFVLGDLHCGLHYPVVVLEEIFPKEEADIDSLIYYCYMRADEVLGAHCFFFLFFELC